MKKLTTQEFIEKAIKIHGDKYDYSKTVYFGNKIKLNINCPIHGEFNIIPTNHVERKIGCSKCKNRYKNNIIDFIQKANIIYENFYDYSKVNYIDKNIKIKIICPLHGNFTQTPIRHLKGIKCPKCAKNNKNTGSILNFINKSNSVHNNKYSYNKINWINAKTDVIITCPIHGDFKQRPSHHMAGSGCKKCASVKQRVNQTLTLQEFIQKSNEKHNFKYDYTDTIYDKGKNKLKIICPLHGYFVQKANNHLNGKGCPKCKYIISKPEIEIQEYIKNLGFEILTNKRNIIKPKELDIYIPELKKAIEFNGEYWHYSKKHFIPGEHGLKSNLCRKKGIKLLHIRENLWIKNKEKMKKSIEKFLYYKN